MYKNKFKKLVISKGGEILSSRKFKYKEDIYFFYYFVKNSKQWILGYPRVVMKSGYKNELFWLSQNEIINDSYSKDKSINFDDLFWWFILLRMLIIRPIIFLFFYWKNKYSDLDTRIKELNHWSLACPDTITKNESITKKEKIHWSFDKFIINDYAKRTNKEIIPTFENYMALKQYTKDNPEKAYSRLQICLFWMAFITAFFFALFLGNVEYFV